MPRTYTRIPPEVRFERFVSVGESPEYAPELGPCHIWSGYLNARGYGQFAIDRTTWIYAHRFSWEMKHGNDIPDGMQIDHLCRVPQCVNPDHLECVTPKVNVRRAVKARNGRCLSGKHLIEGDNVYVNPANGRRSCHACRLASMRAWRQRQTSGGDA